MSERPGSPWNGPTGRRTVVDAGVPCRPRCRQAGFVLLPAPLSSPPARDGQTPVPVEVTITGPPAVRPPTAIVQIRAGELAEAVVVVDLRGNGTYADNVDVLADAARMTVVWIADWADDMVHLALSTCRLGGTRCCARRGSLGGDVVRMAATVRYDAPAEMPNCSALGYFADAGQHLESRSCRSFPAQLPFQRSL